jgi:stress-induced-phosphoprotein 1
LGLLQGNKEFQAGNFEEAVKHYTDAIGHDATDHVFYSNRSACLSSLSRYDEALADANKCIELKPDFAKAYSRKGAALHGAGKLQEATAAYEDGLKIDPNNAALKSGLDDVKKATSQQGQASILNMFMSPEGQAKLMSDPETAAYMRDPQFMQMLQMCQQNPQMINMLMQSDPRIMKCLSVVMGVNLQQQGAPGAPPPQQEAPKPKKEPEPPKELTEEEKAELKLQEEAAAEKALGTTAYKAKDFDTAVVHYQKAYEIYVKDISPLTNIAACQFEQDDFEGCIDTCMDAIAKGREVMCDYKLIAKAFVRIGNTHMRRAARADGFEAKEPFYNEAIEAYAKSLLEHYTNDAFDRQKKAKALLKKHKEAAYQDPEKAAAAKEQGNEHFKKSEFVQAQECYSEAIARDPKNHLYLSNRATCYIKMNEMELALKDLDACIKLDPTFPKAYLNKANILYHRKEFHKVIPLYELVLELAEEAGDEASKQKAKDGLAQTQQAIQRAQYDAPDEERLQRAQADPEIQAILSDPMVQQAIRDFQENPKYAQQALKEPQMAAKLSKLAAAGILRFQ